MEFSAFPLRVSNLVFVFTDSIEVYFGRKATTWCDVWISNRNSTFGSLEKWRNRQPFRWKLILHFIDFWPLTELQATETPVYPKIFCWVVTQPANKLKAEAVKQTWGRKCDKLVFASSQNGNAISYCICGILLIVTSDQIRHYRLLDFSYQAQSLVISCGTKLTKLCVTCIKII